MKINKIVNLFLALCCFINSYSMESNKRDRDAYEKNFDQELKHDENIIKKRRMVELEEKSPEKEKESENIAEEIYQSGAIDEQTGLPLTLIDQKEAYEDIIQYAKKRNYPSSYLQQNLIDPEMSRIDTNNLIVRLYSLPNELIEQIFLFIMISIFKDTINVLANSDLGTDSANDLLAVFQPFKDWQDNLPYPKLLTLIRSFPLQVRRELIGSSFIKKELPIDIKSLLVNLFRSNDVIAGRYLYGVISSDNPMDCKDKRYQSDVLMFARYLVEAGIHPNQLCYKVKDGKRVEIMRQVYGEPFSLLEFALSIGNYGLTKFLMDEKKGDITKVSKKLRCLTQACKNDSLELVRLIQQHRINWYREPVAKAFIVAIKLKACKVLAYFIEYLILSNEIELLKELIDNGLDVNEPNLRLNWFGRVSDDFVDETPLMSAVRCANYEIVRKLIEEWGAIIDEEYSVILAELFTDYDGRSPDQLKIVQYLASKRVCLGIKVGDGERLMHFAAQNNWVEMLKFLKDNGFDIETLNDYDWTSLICAARYRAIDAIRCLVESGAEVNAKDDNGYTALFHCFDRQCGYFNKELINYLLKNGANAFELFMHNKSKINLLHLACYQGNWDEATNLEAVKFLVEEIGLDINEPDSSGNTPLMFAKKCNAHVIVEYLESRINS